jgi:hypothetical protein
MHTRNPKQDGSILFDCKPQVGLCPMNCNQCFYNREGAFYVDINEPHIPPVEDVGDGIVRMNCGHDSNFEKSKVIEAAKQYKRYFFNTSVHNFLFPGPVVFTANPAEEEPAYLIPDDEIPYNLMFVRLRVSATNLFEVEEAVNHYCYLCNVPVVLTFMAYYEEDKILDEDKRFYEYKVRHVNSYWCPTKLFITQTVKIMKLIGGNLVSLCGTLDSNYCKDCRNCETYYIQCMKHMQELGYGKDED